MENEVKFKAGDRIKTISDGFYPIEQTGTVIEFYRHIKVKWDDHNPNALNDLFDLDMPPKIILETSIGTRLPDRSVTGLEFVQLMGIKLETLCFSHACAWRDNVGYNFQAMLDQKIQSEEVARKLVPHAKSL